MPKPLEKPVTRRSPERHPSIPPGSVVQNEVMERYHGRIRSIYMLNQLVAECVQAGAPNVVVPENSAQKYGRWYPPALLDAIDAKLAERRQSVAFDNIPPDWLPRKKIAKILGMGYETVAPIIDALEAAPDTEEPFGYASSSKGNRVVYYSPAFVELVRRVASQSREQPKSPKVREKITPPELPPPASPEELTADERVNVASDDPKIVAVLRSVDDKLREIVEAMARVKNPQVIDSLTLELEIAQNNAQRLAAEVLVHSREKMTPAVLGLQRLVERMHSNLRAIGAIDEDDE